MSNIAKITGLSLLGLMASATLALAQPPAADGSNSCQVRTEDGCVTMPGVGLEPWHAKPGGETAASSDSKKGIQFPGLRFERWDEKDEPKAESLEPRPAKTSTEPKKSGLIPSFKFEPWHEKAETKTDQQRPEVAAAQPVKASSEIKQSDKKTARAEEPKTPLKEKPADEKKKNGLFPGLKLEPWTSKD